MMRDSAISAAILAVALSVSCLFAQTIEGRERLAAGIVKGVTTEAEIDESFGRDFDEITVTEPVTREDNQDFCLFLAERIPAELTPVYPLPSTEQKTRYYEFREDGQCMVLLVTLDSHTFLVDDFAVFRFPEPSAPSGTR